MSNTSWPIDRNLLGVTIPGQSGPGNNSNEEVLCIPQSSSIIGALLSGYYRDIGPAVRVFANGPGDLGSIPGRVIPKTLKMELDTTLLNTQHYKVRFKGKVEQSREWSSALPYTLV